MTTAARDVLVAFEALPPAEQQQVAAEILCRSSVTGDLPDAAFDKLAAELFRRYDEEEAVHGQS